VPKCRSPVSMEFFILLSSFDTRGSGPSCWCSGYVRALTALSYGCIGLHSRFSLVRCLIPGRYVLWRVSLALILTVASVVLSLAVYWLSAILHIFNILQRYRSHTS
jgi:hypothetical protein